ncbi:HNH endonuclease family protein [Microbacterium sp. NRRL B-14842]|uniref:HNH endonuclease family protein n=1 Tax=Microbacterium TaxID=33882 RepID=UPI001877FB6A|nr:MULTISPECIES: HNH endonuclease family protein [unclassified Microbacterium]
MTRRTTRTASAAGALVVALLAGAIALTTQAASSSPAATIETPPPASAAPPATPSADLTAEATASLEQLEQLDIAEADNQDTYQRDAFGQRWADIDRNGCDQRNDALAAALEDITTKPGTHDCVVLTGTLHDPYTGLTITFQRGQGTSELVQIDHIVPLAWVWRQGADEWDETQREHFANDPLNLQATDGSANQSKSDRGPAEWMPPAADYGCVYASRFVDVLAAYQLTVNPADYTALRAQLTSCAA